MSVFLVLSWSVFSFIFWRLMREYAVEEDKTFNCMFYGTLSAIAGARIVYVLFHWEQFSDAIIKVAALWVAPGLSLYGGLIFGIATMLFVAKKQKVRIGSVLDSLAPSLCGALLVGKIGSFLSGSDVGKVASLPWAVRYAGSPELRHPVALYEALSLFVIFLCVLLIEKKAVRLRWAYGIVGIVFFLMYSSVSFGLEFLKVSGIYWRNLSANQWILLALFCEAVGALYVRGGKRQIFRSIYGWFSKKNTG